MLTIEAAEFRGPGTHHRFEDSGDDYDMDMDQRTRFLGGGRGGGRIILLGDGTEILTTSGHDDDGDIDMEDRGEAEEANDEEEKDLEEQVKRGQQEANGVQTESSKSDASSESKPEAAKTELNATTAEPKMMVSANYAEAKGDNVAVMLMRFD